MYLQISELMRDSGVSFGTSGARGLSEAMTDPVCHAYTLAFLDYLRASGRYAGGEVALAGDYRPSTPRILAAVARAVIDAGGIPKHCGFVPTPALASHALSRRIPGIMVTGSHIPDDRNGIKFYTPHGEILKPDEQGIAARRVELRAKLDTADALPAIAPGAADDYVARYVDFFPSGSLAGRRIGLYEHSSVARETFLRILEGLGAEVIRLGRSDTFVPVDTEAIRAEDIRLAREWSAEYRLDAIVSADGDGDRPLIADENGEWLRGDIAGILCAREIGARCVVTPVSSNTALESTGWFDDIRRTRIGSPYVIEAMQVAEAEGRDAVVGYEANGGFLLQTPVERDGRRLAALPTRDAILVPLALLAAAARRGHPLSALSDDLPPRHTHSDRIREMPTETSRARIDALIEGGAEAIDAWLGSSGAPLRAIDTTDGLRITTATGEIVHLRPSGNAPELRCYTEAETPQRALALNRECLEKLEAWK